MSEDAVPTKFARSLLNLVVERGYDYRGMLASAELDFDPMDSQDRGQPEQISAMQYSRLYQQVLSLLQDETFGLQSGYGVTPGAFRMMCYCIIGCDTLGTAIRRACEFYRTFFQEQAQISFHVGDECAVLGYAGLAHKNPGEEADATDAYSLSVWHRFFCWLIGKPVDMRAVHFKAAAPSSEDKRARYNQLFTCDVLYDMERDEMLLEASELNLPVVQNEQSLKDFLRTAPYQLMVFDTDSNDSNLVSRVRALMGHDYSQGMPSFERVTEALNMSAPTLRRHLKREGTTFQQLKDECRRDAATAYLGNPDLSINAVAALMGFTDASAFHRSFKKWTGMTPGEYRQREHARP